ncbi:MAG: hypothetical protein QW566_04325, partial [Candidatus Jordarchaeales archaeon]
MIHVGQERKYVWRIIILPILVCILILLPYLPVASAGTITREFQEDCVGTKYTIKVSTEDTWNLPGDYKVTVTITIRDMGGNQYLL